MTDATEYVLAHEAAIRAPDGHVRVWRTDLGGGTPEQCRTARGVQEIIAPSIWLCCGVGVEQDGYSAVAHGFLGPSLRTLLQTIKKELPVKGPATLHVCISEGDRNLETYRKEISDAFPGVAYEVRRENALLMPSVCASREHPFSHR